MDAEGSSVTIRDYIKRRLWVAAGVGTAIWLGTAGLVYSRLELTQGELMLGLLLHWVPERVLRSLVCCPKCSSHIGHRVALFGSEPKQCPSCGIALDEPMPVLTS